MCDAPKLSWQDFKKRHPDLDWRPVGDLRPKSFKNPNRMEPQDRALLRRSIEEDGLVPPLLVRAETMEVVDGEHRWEIARDDLGWLEVPVIIMSMTDQQARIIAMRRIKARGSQVDEYVDLLMRELADMEALEEAQYSLLLSDDEVSRWDAAFDEGLLEEEPQDPTPPERSPAPAAAQRAREEVLSGPRKPLTHRVNVLFMGGEAELVKRVLGRAPSQRIVEFCHYWEKHDMDERCLDSADGEDA